MIVQCLNRSNKYDDIEVKSVADYMPSRGFSLHKPLGKKKDSPYYIDQFGTFDIETTSRTRIEKDDQGEEVTKPIDAFMYVCRLALMVKKCMVDTGKILLFYLIKYKLTIKQMSHGIL